jgi:hypothetical protein
MNSYPKFAVTIAASNVAISGFRLKGLDHWEANFAIAGAQNNIPIS